MCSSFEYTSVSHWKTGTGLIHCLFINLPHQCLSPILTLEPSTLKLLPSHTRASIDNVSDDHNGIIYDRYQYIIYQPKLGIQRGMCWFLNPETMQEIRKNEEWNLHIKGSIIMKAPFHQYQMCFVSELIQDKKYENITFSIKGCTCKEFNFKDFSARI